MAREYVRRGSEAISALPATEARRCLEDLGEYILTRQS
jgi:geranylgeranyl pyrophosphate synthase